MLAVTYPGFTSNPRPTVVAISLDAPLEDLFTLRCTVIRSEAGDRVLSVEGEIDASNLASFEVFLQDAAEDMRPFVIDLTRVEFACAGVYSLLLALASRTRYFGPAWALAAGRQIGRHAQLMGLTSPVIVAGSLECASAALAAKIA